MKKDKWIELGILIVIPGTIALGVAYMQSYLSFGWIVAFALGVSIVFYICAKYSSEPNEPKIEVLDVNRSKNYVALHVKNVGAEGEVTAMVDKAEFEVRWFKTTKDIKEVGGEKEADLKRGSERYVIIRRRAVIGTGQRMSDFGLHSITLRFPETNQEFKYAFRITEEGIEDFSPLRRRR
jgi:hypothetical protein